MKKIFAICLVCLSIISVDAQKLNEADVPVVIKNAFVKNVSWHSNSAMEQGN